MRRGWALAPIGDGAPTMADLRAGCVVEIKSGDWFLGVKGIGRAIHADRCRSARGNRHREDVLGLRLSRPPGAGARSRALVEPIRRILGWRRHVRAWVAVLRDDAVDHRSARRRDRGRLPARRRRPGHAGGVRADWPRPRPQQFPYDLAAPWLCLREAGGVVSDGWGEPLDRHRLLGSGHEFQMSSISAANAQLHERARAGGRCGGRAAQGDVHVAPPRGASRPGGADRYRAARRQSTGTRRQLDRLPMLQPVLLARKQLSDYATSLAAPWSMRSSLAPMRCAASASCTSRRPRSAVASRRSSTRSSR